MTGCQFDTESSSGGPLVIWLDEITEQELAFVGDKSLNLARVRRLDISMPESLGEADPLELVVDGADSGGPTVSGRASAVTSGPGIAVPDAFVLTTHLASHLLSVGELKADLVRLADRQAAGELSLADYSRRAAEQISSLRMSPQTRRLIEEAYSRLLAESSATRHGGGPDDDVEAEPVLVAVRSNAVGEDRPGTSFAGQFDSVLSVSSADELIDAYLKVLASSFSLRALSYRLALSATDSAPRSQRSTPGPALEMDPIAPLTSMSVLVQRMVRSDLGLAGVMITSAPDPKTSVPPEAAGTTPGEPRPSPVTIIEVARGTGQMIVGGAVTPETHVLRSGAADSLPANPILEASTAALLQQWGQALEVEFSSAVEVEWALDARTAELAVVQVRPVTGWEGGPEQEPVVPDKRLLPLARGVAIGTATVEGAAVVVDDPTTLFEDDAANDLPEDFVLVVATTSPEWVPLMRLAAALVTDVGGRGSHAAIVCRELGLPAVLGCGDATIALRPFSSVGSHQGSAFSSDRSAPGTRPRARVVVVDCTDGATGTVYG